MTCRRNILRGGGEMRENAKLHIFSSDGRTFEDPKYQNTVLENIYKIGLFDLAYLLAISLNGEFMSKNERSSCSRLTSISTVR
jgi:hypothetical protein